MKGKLIKCTHFYALQIDNDIIAVSLDKETESHTVNYKYSLSKQNCDEIFEVLDTKKLANERSKTCEDCDVPVFKAGYYDGFQEGFEEAMELNKDKVFTVEDMENCWDASFDYYRNDSKDSGVSFEMYIQSLQQPKQIEVEIEMDRIPADLAPGGWDVFPKLDAKGCLILKKIR